MRSRGLAGGVAVWFAATALALSLGFWLKDRCTTHPWDGYQYRTSCYNDIFSLYFFRGLQGGQFPYVDGDGTLDTQSDGDLEYPVVTGYFVGAAAVIVEGGQKFFRANAIGLSLFGLVAALLTVAMARDRRRSWALALGPALILYAFHNWDLIAVAFMVAGLFAFHRGADRTAGAMLGFGAAAKVFPGLILPALMLARRHGNGKMPWGMAGWAAGSWLALNLPIFAINPEGWALAYRFQGSRFPNFETSWYMIFRHFQSLNPEFWSVTWPRLTSVLAGALFLASAALLLRLEWRRPVFRPYVASFGILLLFLLTGKVYSPQFALWLLPFFVLLRLPWVSYAAFVVTDVAVWAAISAYFLAQPPLAVGDASLRLTFVEIAVWVRYAVLGWLVYLSRRAEENVAEPARVAEPAPAPVESLA